MGKYLGDFPADHPDHPWAKPRIVFGIRPPPSWKPARPVEPEPGGAVPPDADAPDKGRGSP